MLRVRITSFNSPFSFFCSAETVGAGEGAGARGRARALEQQLERWLQEGGEEAGEPHRRGRHERLHFEYGDYVAVRWQNRWARAIVRNEGIDLSLWLIDYGEEIKVQDDAQCLKLPQQFKRQPSDIFEASVHGVTPASWFFNESQFSSVHSCTGSQFSDKWSIGAIDLSVHVLNEAKSLLFEPIALLTTKNNDIVLGNLYVKCDQELTNFIDVLEKRGDYIVRAYAEEYVKNMEKFYTSRRIHRASLTNPDFTHNLLKLSFPITIDSYTAITSPCNFLDGDTVGRAILASYRASQHKIPENLSEKYKIVYALSAADTEKYCNMLVMVNGEVKNLLSVIKDKIEDLNMCEKYKEFDVKYIGRANYRCCTRNRHH